MVWITREHPKIDRIACPWLTLRFMARVHIEDPSK
ncbi:MAG TPA: chromate resistance protein ChrB domain-containing protein [Steroidobacteraceae bacterium]|nr:chromate resistance protein ChrB domain-containing protein [Steroidobacteraceae bacterium]